MEIIIAKNRINYDTYIIEKVFSAGMVLFPIEVKVINTSSCNLKGSYVKIIEGQAYITNMYIQQTEYRPRVLLLKRKEILVINDFLKRGFTVLPDYVFKKNNLLKIRLNLAKYTKAGGRKDKDHAFLRDLKKEMKKTSSGICKF